MFRMWKRWLLVALQVAAVAATTALGVYCYKVKPENVNWWTAGGILAAIFVLTLLSAVYTYIHPVRELEPFVIDVLNTYAQHIVDFAQAQNIQIRLNIAIVCFYPFQLSWPLRRFKIVWDCGMKYAADVFHAFPVAKGVAGAAYRGRRDLLVDMEASGNVNLGKWGFSHRDASIFPKFTAVWSLPIYRLTPDNHPTARVRGMLNLDSTTAGAFRVLADPNHPEISLHLQELRALLCKLGL